LVVYVDNYDLHANANFTILGSMPHIGTLAGNLMLLDEQRGTIPLSHIEAYSRISIPESGVNDELLQPLYHQFAVSIADSISGAHILNSAERDDSRR
jgi:hypothetical protein